MINLRKKIFLCFKKEKTFFTVILIYLVLGTIFIFKYSQYQINPDGTAYISIARKYLQADFSSAINAYWGPLYSWLLTPFLFIGLEPLLGVKILSLLIGSFVFYGIRLLSDCFEIKKNIKTVILFSLIPTLLVFSFSFITPDLLVVCLLLYYFCLIFSSNYQLNFSNGLLAGLIGTLAYLTKSYNFYFFLGHFVVFNLLHYLVNRNKQAKIKIVKNLFLGLLTFIIFSGLWIYLISQKYQKITIGTSGQFNLALIGPESAGAPMHYQGFLKPPNQTAISAWEDPSYFKMVNWNPLASVGSIKIELNRLYWNFYMLVSIFQSFSIFSLTIIFGYLLFLWRSLKGFLIKDVQLLYPILSILIYSLGYVIIYVDPRYLWIDYFLLLLMGSHLLSRLFGSRFFESRLNNKDSRVKKLICLIIFTLSFIPIMSLIKLPKDAISGKPIFSLSQILKEKYHLQGKMASNKNWDTSLYLAYYLGNQYYGEAKKNLNSYSLTKELKKDQINYYLFWEDENRSLSPLSDYTEITKGKITGLEIYQLK